MRFRINIMHERLARQPEYDAGFLEGQATYKRFEQHRDLEDLKEPPSDAWIAGYKAGYARAERGRS